MEIRKLKVGVKHGAPLRGVTDRLKQQSAINRIEKRRETTKRFRRSTDVTLTTSYTDFALQNAVHAIKSTDKTISSAGISTLRQFLCSEDPPIQAVVDSGIIPDLIRILAISDNAPIPDVIWCLTNIATGNHTQTGAVIAAVPALLSILNKICGGASAYDEQLNHALCEEVCWAIGNIAGDSDDYRVLLLESGTLKPMVNFMLDSLNRLQLASTKSTQSEGVGVVVAGSSPLSCSESNLNLYQSRAQTAVWAISNMARGSVPGAIFLESGIVAPLLGTLILQHSNHYPSLALQTEVCWLFVFLTAKEDTTVSALIGHQISQIFINLASFSNPTALTTVPCMRVLVNLSSGPTEWLETLFSQATFLPALVNLCDVSIAQKAVVKESLLVLKNLLGSSCRQQVIHSSSAPLFLQCIATALLSDVFELQREALSLVILACQDDNLDIYVFFASVNVVRQIIHLLKAPDVDVTLHCLEVLQILSSEPRTGVRSVFDDLGLHDVLDQIQYGPGDSEVRRLARQMAEDIFETEEEEEEEAAAVVTAQPTDYEFSQTFFSVGLQGSISMNLPASSNDVSNSLGRGSGVGRGSHLVRPAWMTPN